MQWQFHLVVLAGNDEHVYISAISTKLQIEWSYYFSTRLEAVVNKTLDKILK